MLKIAICDDEAYFRGHIREILKREMESCKNKISRLEIQNQMEMYRTASENLAKQRKLTHEYKNQLLCIESLISAKKYV